MLSLKGSVIKTQFQTEFITQFQIGQDVVIFVVSCATLGRMALFIQFRTLSTHNNFFFNVSIPGEDYLPNPLTDRTLLILACIFNSLFFQPRSKR